MSRIIILYDSTSGTTEKMAKAVAEGASTVKGAETQLYKIGTPFSIHLLNEADGIILGSPSAYGLPTRNMMGFIEAATHRTKSRLREKLNLAGKKGGVFESYAWEEGDVLESLTDALKSWGVKVIPPMVAAMDRQLSMGIPINEESVKKCRELGKAVAEEVTRA